MSERGRPAGILKEEHAAVLAKLQALENLLGRLADREAVRLDLRELGEFFARDFWLHFDKEEYGLFVELGRYVPRHAGPLQMMLDEHVDLRNLHEVFNQSLADYLAANDTPLTRETMRRTGLGFIAALRSHIEKEDGMILTLANAHLTPAEEERVVLIYGQIEAAAAARLAPGCA
jgi:hemerythrin-like domain-containing protein